ncbi:MAG: cell division protein SepF [Ruminococcaceae bacterium]|nr:cell division protein SepF [Oscillospiraceae bacterium]
MGIFGFGKKIDYEDFEDDEDELEYEDDDASLSLGGSNIELKVIKPTQFNQILTAGDHLIEGKTVLLNLEGLDKALTRRMIDFIAGVAYALNATIKSATNNSYFIAPRDVDVSGEIFDSSDDDTFCDL